MQLQIDLFEPLVKEHGEYSMMVNPFQILIIESKVGNGVRCPETYPSICIYS